MIRLRTICPSLRGTIAIVSTLCLAGAPLAAQARAGSAQVVPPAAAGWWKVITVLADDSGILWVIGVRRSARAPVTTGTQRALWVHAERHD